MKGRIELAATVLLALLSLVISGYVGYTRSDKELTSRVSALEANRTNDKGQLDHIQSQVDRLVEWAMGKK